MTSRVRLDLYNNAPYSPGRNVAWRIAWLFIGLPLLGCRWLPISIFRIALLRLFGATIGTGVVVRSSVSVKYPWHLRIGDHCWIGEQCWIDNLTTIHLGDHVCVSQGAYFCAGNHDWTDPHFGLRYAPITLDNGSWVGAKSLLLSGLHLGEGSVITAGSVASGRIAPWEIHAGHPARFVRRRTVNGGTRKPVAA